MTLLDFQEGEYNTVPAVTTSVSIRKSPLEQNQTQSGMESDVLDTDKF